MQRSEWGGGIDLKYSLGDIHFRVGMLQRKARGTNRLLCGFAISGSPLRNCCMLHEQELSEVSTAQEGRKTLVIGRKTESLISCPALASI